MNFVEYVLRRVALLVFVLFGVSLLTFYLSRGVPGVSPIAAYVTQDTPPSEYAQIANYYHLNDPLYIQYWYYLSGIFHGDLGFSRSANLAVTTAIWQFLPATIELALSAIFLSVTFGIPLGIFTAVKANKMPDRLSRIFTLFTFSSPVFWLGLMLQLLFFYYFKIWGFPYLPSGGRVSPTVALEYPIHRITGLYLIDSLIEGNWVFFLDSFWHLILPAITLSLSLIGFVSRVVRISMLEALEQHYITLARSKGLSDLVVLFKHAFRNAMLPALTIIGLAVAYLLAGSVLTEIVFAWPGMGRWAAQAINANDTAAIMGFTLVSATIFVFVNLAVDLLYSVADPRIKYGAEKW